MPGGSEREEVRTIEPSGDRAIEPSQTTLTFVILSATKNPYQPEDTVSIGMFRRYDHPNELRSSGTAASLLNMTKSCVRIND